MPGPVDVDAELVDPEQEVGLRHDEPESVRHLNIGVVVLGWVDVELKFLIPFFISCLHYTVTLAHVIRLF